MSGADAGLAINDNFFIFGYAPFLQHLADFVGTFKEIAFFGLHKDAVFYVSGTRYVTVASGSVNLPAVFRSRTHIKEDDINFFQVIQRVLARSDFIGVRLNGKLAPGDLWNLSSSRQACLLPTVPVIVKENYLGNACIVQYPE